MPYLSELQTTKVGVDKWRLDRALAYYSTRYRKTIKAPSGFEMDYASVPRLPVVYLLVGNTGHRAAAIHDWLYKHGHGQWSRRQVDLIFLDALLETQPKWRAYTMYWGVRAGGWRSWNRYEKRLTA